MGAEMRACLFRCCPLFSRLSLPLFVSTPLRIDTRRVVAVPRAGILYVNTPRRKQPRPKPYPPNPPKPPKTPKTPQNPPKPHPQEFYEDVFEEAATFGELEGLNVCDNLADHMVSEGLKGGVGGAWGG